MAAGGSCCDPSARYYNPATGTFNRLDPFFGVLRDPQSLHKYLYTHADPINFNDPTGQFEGLSGLVSNMGVRANMIAQRLAGAARVMWSGFKLVGETLNAWWVNLIKPLPSWMVWGNVAGLAALAAEYYLPAKRGHVYYRRFDVPITIVRIVPAPGGVMNPPLDTARTAVERASDFWEDYGISFRIKQAVEIDAPTWRDISQDAHGNGEILDVMNSLGGQYKGLIMVVCSTMSEIDGTPSPNMRGVTAASLRGFATNESDWIVTAHELGHILAGRFHPPAIPTWKPNIMQSGLSNLGINSPEEVYATWVQVAIARGRARELAE